MASGWDLWVPLEPDGQQVPALSLPFPNPRAESVQGDPAASPECWGSHGDGTAGVPPGDGDRNSKAKFGFFLFFLSFFNDDYFYCDLTTCFNDTCSLFSNALGTRNKVHKESLLGCCGCAPLFFPALIP